MILLEEDESGKLYFVKAGGVSPVIFIRQSLFFSSEGIPA
jgi:hypothetical protein